MWPSLCPKLAKEPKHFWNNTSTRNASRCELKDSKR
uniref:Uncharacterized protein n=1 Tax=Arundo donax TaxID=35708 RepID=A0A0A8ZCD5_ARUDO